MASNMGDAAKGSAANTERVAVSPLRRNGPPATLSRDAIIAAYRRYAPMYDKLFGAVLEPGRRAMAEAVSMAGPQRILEVGVGTGLTLHRYPASCRTTGIDICEDMLAIAVRRAACLRHRDIRLEAMDAEAMRFDDGAFDCVTVPYVLSVTPNPHRLVAEIRRVCKKGGLILVLNHFSGARGWQLLESYARFASARLGFRSKFDLNDNVLNHSWHVESIKTVNIFGLSRLVAIRNT
jgi:phosphatidylethanolamine/phosphatidyl-N-methylethanolamine N-methyltransferase